MAKKNSKSMQKMSNSRLFKKIQQLRRIRDRLRELKVEALAIKPDRTCNIVRRIELMFAVPGIVERIDSEAEANKSRLAAALSIWNERFQGRGELQGCPRSSMKALRLPKTQAAAAA